MTRNQSSPHATATKATARTSLHKEGAGGSAGGPMRGRDHLGRQHMNGLFGRRIASPEKPEEGVEIIGVCAGLGGAVHVDAHVFVALEIGLGDIADGHGTVTRQPDFGVPGPAPS